MCVIYLIFPLHIIPILFTHSVLSLQCLFVSIKSVFLLLLIAVIHPPVTNFKIFLFFFRMCRWYKGTITSSDPEMGWRINSSRSNPSWRIRSNISMYVSRWSRYFTAWSIWYTRLGTTSTPLDVPTWSENLCIGRRSCPNDSCRFCKRFISFRGWIDTNIGTNG